MWASDLSPMYKACHKFEVFYSIVCFYTVFMMDSFVTFQWSFYKLFHYSPMFKFVSWLTESILEWCNYFYISIDVNLATFPLWVFVPMFILTPSIKHFSSEASARKRFTLCKMCPS